MSTVTVESSRFGTVDVPAEAVIEFPAGLIGLGGRRFALVAGDDQGAFRWLQSLDDGALALPVTDPWSFFSGYEVQLSDEDTARVGGGAADVDVWVTVRAGSDLSDFSANLRAPILVANGLGHQVINEAPDAPVRAPLFAAEPAEQAA
ncbi:MAG TPA: flagellar assembly protein FliW [Gaiellaceae bacterium]|nr:flagellar assembly protein FliW [Gaiellaceae bacterium]